jgi:vacuolar-type H+-ATPase catalytic subunit A/Vma1
MQADGIRHSALKQEKKWQFYGSSYAIKNAIMAGAIF